MESGSAILPATARARLHLVLVSRASVRRCGSDRTPAWKKLRSRAFRASGALERGARPHRPFRLRGPSTVLNGPGNATHFRDSADTDNMSRSKRFNFCLSVDDRHSGLRDRARLSFREPPQRDKRGGPHFLLCRRSAPAPPRRSCRLGLVLRLFLVHVAPLVLADGARIQRRSPRSEPRRDGRRRRFVVAILPPQQRSVSAEGSRRRGYGFRGGPDAILCRKPRSKTVRTPSAASYRRGRAATLGNRRYRSGSFWAIRLSRHRGRRPHLELAVESLDRASLWGNPSALHPDGSATIRNAMENAVSRSAATARRVPTIAARSRPTRRR